MRKKKEDLSDIEDLWDDIPLSYKKEPDKRITPEEPDDLFDFFDVPKENKAPRRKRRENTPRFPTRGVLAAILLLLFLMAVPKLGNARKQQEVSHVPEREETVVTLPDLPEPEDVVPETVPVNRTEDRYYAGKLTAQQRQIYEQIRAGVAVRAEQIGPFHVESEEALQRIVRSVNYDYAEYFWFRGEYTGTYFNHDTYLEYTLTPKYAFSAAEYTRYAAQVESVTETVISALSGKSDYEKVKGVYEYLIDHTVYDMDYMGKTIYEVFSEGRAVCEGYARATQYMLTRLGVEAIYVGGYAGKVNMPRSTWGEHAWNIVKIDGIYYQVDTTWGDPVSEDGTQSKNFKYLNLTDKEMSRDHELDGWTTYPACSDNRHDYYVHEGYYLETFSKDTIEAWFLECYTSGQPLEFKCADETVYRQAYDWLIGAGGFGDLYGSVSSYGTYWYSNDDTKYILGVSK